MEAIKSKIWVVALMALSLFGLASCSDKTQVAAKGNTDFFVQSYDPPTLDILWMEDNRSPMFTDESHIQSEATLFFNRLANSTNAYRIAFVTADMSYADGNLQPAGVSYNNGSASNMANFVGNLVDQIVNVQTSAVDEGFQSVVTALTNNFQPRANIPLVVVFISDSDDHSPVPSSATSAVDAYAQSLTTLKGGNADQIRVYAINYEPLNGAPKTATNRCATRYDADIDGAGFQNRYFSLAQKFAGSVSDPTSVTADLCGSFSSQIDLTGIQLTTLPSTFTLSQPANPSSISVVILNASQSVTIPWTYDSVNNQIDFSSTPPQGSTIEVTYLPTN